MEMTWTAEETKATLKVIKHRKGPGVDTSSRPEAFTTCPQVAVTHRRGRKGGGGLKVHLLDAGRGWVDKEGFYRKSTHT